MCKYHYIYKTTNIINNKIYIGKHSTSNLDDEYFGSGSLLKIAIKKYGIENFKKEILRFFDTSEEALAYEKELVTKEFLNSSDTYNLTTGGSGGWYAANEKYKEASLKNKRKAGSISLLKRWQDPFEREKMLKIKSETSKRMHKEGRAKIPDWTGKKHKEESKSKIGQSNSEKQKGERNSQYGTCWIHSPVEKQNKKIKKENLGEWESKGWILGRKYKS